MKIAIEVVCALVMYAVAIYWASRVHWTLGVALTAFIVFGMAHWRDEQT